jgi:hypothetical protein
MAASAFPSMGIDDPAARLAVRGPGVVALGPGGEVRGRIAVPVRRKTTTTTAKGSLCQSDGLAQRPALRAGLGGREPAVAGDQFGAQPGCLVAELAAKLSPGGITDCASETLVAREVGDGEVLDGQLGVGLDKLARDLVKEASPQVSNASVPWDKRRLAWTRLREPGLVRDQDFERRWRRLSRLVSGLDPCQRPTSARSDVAATTKAESPRSIPTNPGCPLARRWG